MGKLTIGVMALARSTFEKYPLWPNFGASPVKYEVNFTGIRLKFEFSKYSTDGCLSRPYGGTVKICAFCFRGGRLRF